MQQKTPAPAHSLHLLSAIIGAAVTLSVTALAVVAAFGGGLNAGRAECRATRPAPAVQMIGPATSCTTDTDCETRYPELAARPGPQ